MPTPKKKPVVAVQLYSLRTALDAREKLDDTFAKVKKIGYDYAQISGVVADVTEATELRKIMLGAGVEPIGAHISLSAWLGKNFGKSVKRCHEYGVKYAAIPWLDWSEYNTLSAWKKLVRTMEATAEKARTEGIILQYHNHDFEFSQFGIKNGKGGKTALELLYENTKTIQAELDFGWIVRGGDDPVSWAEKVAGRMDQAHFKDWGLVDGEWTFRSLGEGRINWPAIAKACLKGGTRTFIVEQDTFKVTNDPFKSLKISRDYLKTFLG